MSAEGSLRLRFETAGGRTVLARSEQRPPLRVVRAFSLPDGGALAHLHNLSGGILGGDRLSVFIEVGPGAAAQLTTTGATRLYRGAVPATQHVSARIEEDALLEYVPDATIPFAGSRYLQTAAIDLGARAGLFWWDIFAPGRDARGEVFAYNLLESRLEIRSEGCPVATESIRLEPHLRPPSSPARLGPFRYWAVFYVCRAGLDPAAWKQLESCLAEAAVERTQPPQSIWTVSTLSRCGLVVRALSREGLDIASGLAAFWRIAKRDLYGRDPVSPRKVN